MKTTSRNLALDLYERMKVRSPLQASRWYQLFTSHPNSWTETNVPNMDIQMRTINTFWHTQLGMMETNTLHVRRCIIEGISPDIWLQNFERYVMPLLLENEEVPNGRWNIINPLSFA